MEPAVAHVERVEELPAALAGAGLTGARPTVALVGGAGGMDEAGLAGLAVLFADLVPAVERLGATVVDGGTDAGVMRLLGCERAVAGAGFPLVGVLVEALAADVLEPNHTHLVFVPGEAWGDEAPWLAAVAGLLAGDRPSLTLLVNGGDIALLDAAASVEARRPVLVVAGSGRTADLLARATRTDSGDARAAALAASGLVRRIEFDGRTGGPVVEAVEEILEGRA